MAASWSLSQHPPSYHWVQRRPCPLLGRQYSSVPQTSWTSCFTGSGFKINYPLEQRKGSKYYLFGDTWWLPNLHTERKVGGSPEVRWTVLPLYSMTCLVPSKWLLPFLAHKIGTVCMSDIAVISPTDQTVKRNGPVQPNRLPSEPSFQPSWLLAFHRTDFQTELSTKPTFLSNQTIFANQTFNRTNFQPTFQPNRVESSVRNRLVQIGSQYTLTNLLCMAAKQRKAKHIQLQTKLLSKQLLTSFLPPYNVWVQCCKITT